MEVAAAAAVAVPKISVRVLMGIEGNTTHPPIKTRESVSDVQLHSADGVTYSPPPAEDSLSLLSRKSSMYAREGEREVPNVYKGAAWLLMVYHLVTCAQFGL